MNWLEDTLCKLGVGLWAGDSLPNQLTKIRCDSLEPGMPMYSTCILVLCQKTHLTSVGDCPQLVLDLADFICFSFQSPLRMVRFPVLYLLVLFVLMLLFA